MPLRVSLRTGRFASKTLRSAFKAQFTSHLFSMNTYFDISFCMPAKTKLAHLTAYRQ
jgi:hypothetical protein